MTVKADQSLTTGPVVIPPLHNDLLIRYLDGQEEILQKTSTSPDGQNIEHNAVWSSPSCRRFSPGLWKHQEHSRRAGETSHLLFRPPTLKLLWTPGPSVRDTKIHLLINHFNSLLIRPNSHLAARCGINRFWQIRSFMKKYCWRMSL